MLEIAQGPIGGREVAQGRTSDGDSPLQDGLDRAGQHVQATGGDPACGPEGRDARLVQGLADIDVSQPGHGPLVQEKGLGPQGGEVVPEHRRPGLAAAHRVVEPPAGFSKSVIGVGCGVWGVGRINRNNLLTTDLKEGVGCGV